MLDANVSRRMEMIRPANEQSLGWIPRQTLALEASTILENARLLQEEREKQRMEEELNVAREIQRSLLPNDLPTDGWFRAAGSSIDAK